MSALNAPDTPPLILKVPDAAPTHHITTSPRPFRAYPMQGCLVHRACNAQRCRLLPSPRRCYDDQEIGITGCQGLQ